MIIDEIEDRITGYGGHNLRAKFREQTKNLTYLRIQNVSDYYYFGANKESWDPASSFPGCRPPWKKFWAEWRIPQKIRGNDKEISTDKDLLGLGFAVLGEVSDSGKNGECTMLSRFLTNAPGLHPIYAVSRERFLGNGDLRLDGHEVSVEDPLGSFNPDDLLEVRSEIEQSVNSSLFQVLLAFSFANCKNTNIVESRLGRGLIKKRRERGKLPVDKFYTLEIEPMKKAIKAAQESHGVGVQKALHICRGHFKDFRSGPGLFGTHRNVYWWDQQVRGDEALGKIEKDYAIKGPQNGS